MTTARNAIVALLLFIPPGGSALITAWLFILNPQVGAIFKYAVHNRRDIDDASPVVILTAFIFIGFALAIAEFLVLRIGRNIWPRQFGWLYPGLPAAKPDGQTRVSAPSSAGPPKRGAQDLLAEAQVHIAYGRKQQALALLEKALQENPSRADVETKLRELKGQSALNPSCAVKGVAEIHEPVAFIQKKSSWVETMMSGQLLIAMFWLASFGGGAAAAHPEISIPPSYFLALFGFYITVACGFGTVLGIRSLSWGTVRGRITEKGVTRNDLWTSRERGLWWPRVRYHYVIDGREYNGDRIAFNQFSSLTKESASKYVERFGSGPECEVYFNPSNPALSALRPGATPMNLFFLVLGVALMATGFLLGD